MTDQGSSMGKILTARELSQYLKLSESTIYKLAIKGEIPGFKIGDSWRFELEEIKKMIRQSKKKGRRQKESSERKDEKIEKQASLPSSPDNQIRKGGTEMAMAHSPDSPKPLPS